MKGVLNNLMRHASYAYNRIISSVRGDISAEVFQDPALDELWREAEKGEDYQKVAKVVADKVQMDTMKMMSNHPIQEYKGCLARLSVIQKEGTRLMLLD